MKHLSNLLKVVVTVSMGVQNTGRSTSNSGKTKRLFSGAKSTPGCRADEVIE